MVTVTGQSPSPRAPQGQSVLEAVLERITYANDDTGYTVARVATERTGPDLLTVVGPLLGAQVGESLRLTGRWSSHPRYGTQFEVHSYTTVLPATIQGIRRYLGSGMIKGIGPMMAERMVTHFGTDILTIIEEEPGRLTEVHGLGPKRTKKIADAWEEQKAIKEVMVFLSGVGVSTSLAVRIYKKYADSSISVVRNEPYRLASEVWGIGFKTADTIARAVGIPHDSPERIKAGLQYTLSEAADDGHCYLPEPNLIRDATKILEVDRELIGPCLDELAAGEGVVREPVPAGDDATGGAVPAVYLVPFYRAECSLAGGLMDLLNCGQERLPAFARVDWHKALGWLRSQTRQELAPEQLEAVKLALSSKAAVLTGGPGCGKSFTVRSIVELATAKKATVVLVAPTGRAAKRLAELTGHEASTVHRLRWIGSRWPAQFAWAPISSLLTGAPTPPGGFSTSSGSRRCRARTGASPRTTCSLSSEPRNCPTCIPHRPGCPTFPTRCPRLVPVMSPKRYWDTSAAIWSPMARPAQERQRPCGRWGTACPTGPLWCCSTATAAVTTSAPGRSATPLSGSPPR